MSIWREPPEESTDLYPGFTVDEHRQTGSICFNETRVPTWAITGTLMANGWDGVVDGWDYLADSRDDLAGFLYDLMEMRGEFARLLLVMADAERCERASSRRFWWYQTKRHRKRISKQLRRCLECLE
jgi:hypothetical protein